MVERDLAKVDVEGSIPFARSRTSFGHLLEEFLVRERSLDLEQGLVGILAPNTAKLGEPFTIIVGHDLIEKGLEIAVENFERIPSKDLGFGGKTRWHGGRLFRVEELTSFAHGRALSSKASEFTSRSGIAVEVQRISRHETGGMASVSIRSGMFLACPLAAWLKTRCKWRCR